MGTIEIRKTRTCEKCSTQVPLDKIRLFPRDSTANWLVCESCCEKLKEKNTTTRVFNTPQVKEPVRNVYNPQQAESRVVKQKTDPSFDTKHCNRCNYYFKVDNKGAINLKKIVCPYCGRNDRLGFSLEPK